MARQYSGCEVTKRKEKGWPTIPCPGCGDMYVARLHAIACPDCKSDPIRLAFATARHRIRVEGQHLARDAENAARHLPAHSPLPPIAAERIIESWGRE